MMTGSESPSDEGFHKSHHLSLTIGDDDDDEDDKEEMFDIRSRMQSFALSGGDDDCMPPTIFLDDSDVVPTTSSAALQSSSMSVMAVPTINDDDATTNMDSFVKNFFANDACLFQPPDGNFVEEIFEEKPPKIVGDYLFGNVIGEGSYGKVKEILHTKKLVRRAVKIIKDRRLRKIPGGEQNVEREIELLQRIKHPNIVELFEIFRIDEKQKLYIVMEYCVCSLQQMVDNCSEKKLPEFQAHFYFAQLLDGLDYLHLRGIIHKDIKPGNLLLSLDGKLKICDVGVSEELDGGNEDWCIIAQGTPKFQPPEVVSGAQRSFRGKPVDIWSCGITLYNLVSGEYPFDGDVIMKLFENITTKALEMPTTVELSISLQKLLNGALDKNPLTRWNSVRIRHSDWFTANHEIDKSRIVKVPELPNMAAHRPLGVYHALEQLYEPESERYLLSGEFGETDTDEIRANGGFCPTDCDNNDKPQQVVTSDDESKRVSTATEIKDGKRNTDSGQRKQYDTRPKMPDGTLVENVSSSGGGDKESASGNGGPSKLSKLFRRKNFPNFFQRLISSSP